MLDVIIHCRLEAETGQASVYKNSYKFQLKLSAYLRQDGCVLCNHKPILSTVTYYPHYPTIIDVNLVTALGKYLNLNTNTLHMIAIVLDTFVSFIETGEVLGES